MRTLSGRHNFEEGKRVPGHLFESALTELDRTA